MRPEEKEHYQMQEKMQQNQINAEQGLNAPYTLQQSQAIQAALVEQTNPLHVLKEIELKLKGYEMGGDGKFYKFSEPLMNDKGVSRIKFLLSAVVNQNTTLSHLEDKEVANIIIRLGDDIIDDLSLNWQEYEVPDKVMLDYITDGILIPSFMTLKRGWQQNEKNWLGKATVETINTQPRPGQQKKDGFWARFST